MFLTFNVLTLVLAAVCPGFYATSMLHVVFPVAEVPRTVCMLVKSITVCFVKLPVPFVEVSVGVPKFSLAIGAVVVPLALIFTAVGPKLSTPTLLAFFVLSHVATVDGFIALTLMLINHHESHLLHQALHLIHLFLRFR